jgi:E3 ubiquitin-protein ligase HECTD2
MEEEEYGLMQGTSKPSLLNAFGNATARLVNKLPIIPNPARLPEKLRVYVIVFENPLFSDIAKSHVVVEKLCTALLKLNDASKEILAAWWTRLPADHFQKVVRILSSYLSYLIVSKGAPEQPIISTTLVLEFLFKTNERARVIPYTEFYNTQVSNHVHLEKEYRAWKSGNKLLFSLCRYPFLLTTTAKINILQIHAQHEMGNQIHQAFAEVINGHNTSQLLLFIVVRRESLIHDAIAQLVLADPRDLKKPIRVAFAGEEAIDQGGVTKEFFHLLVHQLFNPDYGMFTYHAEDHTYWINPGSLENEQTFRLVGTVRVPEERPFFLLLAS